MVSLGVAVMGKPCVAQDLPMGMAPQCAPKVMTSAAAPGAAPLTVTINPISAAPACFDQDGDALKLVAAERFTNGAVGELVGNNQVKVSNVGPGGTTFTYAVVDSRGLVVRSVFTIRRP
jgi:hypothetical protein